MLCFRRDSVHCTARCCGGDGQATANRAFTWTQPGLLWVVFCLLSSTSWQVVWTLCSRNNIVIPSSLPLIDISSISLSVLCMLSTLSLSFYDSYSTVSYFINFILYPLIDWFIPSIVCLFLHLFISIQLFNHVRIHPLSHPPIHPSIYLPIHTPVHPFTLFPLPSFSHSFIHSFTHSFIHSFIHSSIHWLIDWLINSFIHMSILHEHYVFRNFFIPWLVTCSFPSIFCLFVCFARFHPFSVYSFILLVSIHFLFIRLFCSFPSIFCLFVYFARFHPFSVYSFPPNQGRRRTCRSVGGWRPLTCALWHISQRLRWLRPKTRSRMFTCDRRDEWYRRSKHWTTRRSRLRKQRAWRHRDPLCAHFNSNETIESCEQFGAVHSPNLPKEKCMSEVVRIVRLIIFHLRKLWKAKFFILCHVIFLLRLQEKFEVDHSWEWLAGLLSYWKRKARTWTKRSEFVSSTDQLDFTGIIFLEPLWATSQ